MYDNAQKMTADDIRKSAKHIETLALQVEILHNDGANTARENGYAEACRNLREAKRYDICSKKGAKIVSRRRENDGIIEIGNSNA